MSTFMFDRLDALLKSNGMTRKALCQLSGHADNYIRMFEKRGKEPPRDFVLLCAQQLGTTSAYLYGETDSPEKEKAPAANRREVTEEDIKHALFGGDATRSKPANTFFRRFSALSRLPLSISTFLAVASSMRFV